MAPIQPAMPPPRYELLGELGRGGMGVVYKARDRETGEVLALKVLKPEIADHSQILERFKNELLLAHKITHRYVARLYEFHRAAGCVYLSMEYVEGESLRALLQRSGKLEIAQGLGIARQLADGLSEAHRQNVAHRDLKPENIMLTSTGEVKIMDFGISRAYGQNVTTTGSVVGTPAYMAPEQAEGRAVDHRTDIYAFGLILYEMFTGAAAFTGDTAVTVALKQVRERPKPPGTLAPGLPKHIEAAILKCLEKGPDARFQSVQDLMGALEGKLSPAIAAPRKGVPRWWIPVAAGVVIAGAAFLIWWRSGPSDSVRFPLEAFTLSNGLRVALSPDHASPTFTLTAAYRAGVRSDPRGRAGLAHLAEHVMFEGSRNVARGEFASLVTGAGGQLNGATRPDMTYFWITLPSNQLDLALFLESDRMRSLEITPEGMKSARGSLLEERALTLTNPTSRGMLRLNPVAYDNPVNQQNGMGTVEEINAATAEDVAKYYQTWFSPSNAGLILVGDFDPKKVRERIRNYFESIPFRGAPSAPDTTEPPRSAEKRETSSDPSLPAAELILSWRMPPVSDPDWFALKRVAEVLGANDAARLNSELIKGAGVATHVYVALEDTAGPNLFMVVALLTPGKDPAQAENLVHQEISKIAREGVPPDELQRFENDALRRRALGLVTTTARGIVFAQFLMAYGNLEAINDWDKQEHTVKSADLQRVTRKYFEPANRTVLALSPGAGRP